MQQVMLDMVERGEELRALQRRAARPPAPEEQGGLFSGAAGGAGGHSKTRGQGELFGGGAAPASPGGLFDVPTRKNGDRYMVSEDSSHPINRHVVIDTVGGGIIGRFPSAADASSLAAVENKASRPRRASAVPMYPNGKRAAQPAHRPSPKGRPAHAQRRSRA